MKHNFSSINSNSETKEFDDKRQGMRENELRLMYKNTIKINTLAMCTSRSMELIKKITEEKAGFN